MLVYNVGEVAAILRIDKRAVYRMVKSGSIGMRLGKGIRITHSEVEKLLGESLEPERAIEAIEAYKSGDSRPD